MFSFWSIALMTAFLSAHISHHSCDEDKDFCETTYPSPYTPCIDPDPIIEYEVTGCTETPCNFRGGESVDVWIKFYSPVNSDKAVMNVSVNWPGKGEQELTVGNMCKVIKPKCPLVFEDVYTMKYHMNVAPIKGCGKVKYTIIDDQGDVFMCHMIEICVDN